MAETPTSPVALEAATFLLDRAAHPQFAQYMDALKAEREKAVRVMLLCNSSDAVLTAKGVAQAYDDLIHRMTNAEKHLNAFEKTKKQKDHAP